MGVPSVFLRLATCNLSCRWCDTKYTWDWQNFDYETEVVDLEESEVQAKIQAFDCSHLVITGGEPMLQQAGLAPLVKSLSEEGYTFEVETNGTIVPALEMLRYIGHWNVSPKLRTSGNPSAGARSLRPWKCLPGCPRLISSLWLLGSLMWARSALCGTDTAWNRTECSSCPKDVRLTPWQGKVPGFPKLA